MMANGYIHPVADGEVTEVRDFVLRCARGMGALVLMRDEPMDAQPPRQFEPDLSHYGPALERAQARLDQLSNANSDVSRAMYEAEKAKHESQQAEWEATESAELERVRTMRTKVAALDGLPEGLQAFMLEQLDRALRDNAPIAYTRQPFPDYDTWFDREWRRAVESVGRAHADIEAEKARVASRNVWLTQLWSALDALAPEPA
jgi:hypothetical protein